MFSQFAIFFFAVLMADPSVPSCNAKASANLEVNLANYIHSYHEAGLLKGVGSAAEGCIADMLAERLAELGYLTTSQASHFEVFKETSSSISALGRTAPATAILWPPDKASDRKADGFLIDDSAADESEGVEGKIVLLPLAPQLAAGLLPSTEKKIRWLEKRGAAGVIVMMATPSGAPFAFNRALTDEPWTIPVVSVGARHGHMLATTFALRQKISIEVNGRRQTISSPNIIARLDRGADQTIVISTPRTGWYTATAERGPGLALLMSLAYKLPALTDKNIVLAVTTAHELEHAGMDAFLQEGAPSPEHTALWIHLGSSIAARRWDPDTKQASTSPVFGSRFLLYSPQFKETVEAAFAHDPGLIPISTSAETFGEVKSLENHAYNKVIGFAGSHALFHTPDDNPEMTDIEMLEKTEKALIQIIQALDE